MDKKIKKAMHKCKKCQFYDKDMNECQAKEINDEKDVKECEYFLVKDKLVMF